MALSNGGWIGFDQRSVYEKAIGDTNKKNVPEVPTIFDVEDAHPTSLIGWSEARGETNFLLSSIKRNPEIVGVANGTFVMQMNNRPFESGQRKTWTKTPQASAPDAHFAQE